MENFPSNSHRQTEKSTPKPKADVEKKDVEQVTTGVVIKRKKPLGQRFKDIFVAGEFKSAASYIAMDVLLPAARNAVVDATSKGIERLMYGESSFRRGRPDPRAGRFSYNDPVRRSTQHAPSTMLPGQPPYSPRRPREANEIILVSREEAEKVLGRLCDIIDQYEFATVADLHELVGLPTSHVDNKWGWSALNFVDIRQVREGFLIDLPSVEPNA